MASLCHYRFSWTFFLIVFSMWINSHILKQEPIDQTAWIILGALLLRIFTIVVALASIQKWGQQFPPWAVLGGLSGSASAQLIYPIAELFAKLVLLTSLIESSTTGLGNMSLTGWFNLSAMCVIFGIPGMLFVLAAKSYKQSTAISNRWAGLVAYQASLLYFNWLRKTFILSEPRGKNIFSHELSIFGNSLIGVLISLLLYSGFVR
ncbi:hypothetical protein GXP67_10235 [Rhodocytophaga rosea]|uniref:Uncharacterized protein n=1 Tax=Rhodocytophaga rosea TaxID=2704465 RepID=A0A6C0GG77_9BACT|nr:hypothetical protein [Rhodocytophaga rosea]QHT66998.1 hypothetical protein GXP67_10235 [Rhodocytophaga rosea]